jgi:hypothetical protein
MPSATSHDQEPAMLADLIMDKIADYERAQDPVAATSALDAKVVEVYTKSIRSLLLAAVTDARDQSWTASLSVPLWTPPKSL